jgi:hypothetical protein
VEGHFSCNLTIRHLVGRFQFDCDTTEFFALEALEELALGFTGTKDQDCFGSLNKSDDVVIKVFAVVPQLSL